MDVVDEVKEKMKPAKDAVFNSFVAKLAVDRVRARLLKTRATFEAAFR